MSQEKEPNFMLLEDDFKEELGFKSISLKFEHFRENFSIHHPKTENMEQ